MHHGSMSGGDVPEMFGPDWSITCGFLFGCFITTSCFFSWIFLYKNSSTVRSSWYLKLSLTSQATWWSRQMMIDDPKTFGQLRSMIQWFLGITYCDPKIRRIMGLKKCQTGILSCGVDTMFGTLAPLRLSIMKLSACSKKLQICVDHPFT